MMTKALIALIIVSMLAIGMSAAEGDEAKTIVETAVADGNFNALLGAIETAGLTETLNGKGPFTVFAPTDEAFAAAEESGQIDIETLPEILKYHIAPGALMMKDIIAMTSIPTLQGGNLTINVTGEGVRVNNANMTKKDIVCSNGVIHVIDAVLMPPLEERLEEENLEEQRMELKELLEDKRMELKERLEQEREKKLLKNVPPSQMPDTPLSEMPSTQDL